jgi:hypothetical protein
MVNSEAPPLAKTPQSRPLEPGMTALMTAALPAGTSAHVHLSADTATGLPTGLTEAGQ